MNLNINIKTDKKTLAVIGILLLLGIVAAADQIVLRDNSASDFPAGITAPNVIYNNTAHVITGSFTRDTSLASGTQAITGLGFKPALVNFGSAEYAGNGLIAIGSDDGITPTLNYLYSTGAAATITTYSVSAMVTGISACGASNSYCGKILSMDADGFTITWTKTGAPAGTDTITYTAYR